MICDVCDSPVRANEPHGECDLTPGKTCGNDKCGWQWTTHSGECDA